MQSQGCRCSMLSFGASNGAQNLHMLLELDSSLLCLLHQRPYSRCICHTSCLETAPSHLPAGAVESLPLLVLQPRSRDS